MFIGCIASQSLFAQEQQTSNEQVVVLKKFVQRLNDPNLATDIILSQDLITSKKTGRRSTGIPIGKHR